MNQIVDFYANYNEWERHDRKPLEFIINWHYIKNWLPKTGRVLDNGAGPGKYAVHLAEMGYDVTLTDLMPSHVELAEQKAAELNVKDQFAGFHIANSANLSFLEDEWFEACLMLGPMYHLQHKTERQCALKELHRVTKHKGVVFVDIMPRTRHILSSLQNPDKWKPNHTVEALKNFQETGIFNSEQKDCFTGMYCHDQSEIDVIMQEAGFEIMQIISSSSIGSILTKDQWNNWLSRDPDEVKALYELLIEMAEDPFIRGVSNHLLVIAKKM